MTSPRRDNVSASKTRKTKAARKPKESTEARYQKIVNKHVAWMKANRGVDEDLSPYYGKFPDHMAPDYVDDDDDDGSANLPNRRGPRNESYHNPMGIMGG
jgi:hypothetical protein